MQLQHFQKLFQNKHPVPILLQSFWTLFWNKPWTLGAGLYCRISVRSLFYKNCILISSGLLWKSLSIVNRYVFNKEENYTYLWVSRLCSKFLKKCLIMENQTIETKPNLGMVVNAGNPLGKETKVALWSSMDSWVLQNQWLLGSVKDTLSKTKVQIDCGKPITLTSATHKFLYTITHWC